MIVLPEGVNFFCGTVLVPPLLPLSPHCDGMLPSPLDSLIPTYLLSADSGVVGLDAALACSLPLAQLWSAASDFCIILPR